jgi:hypothetical protein
VINKSKKCFISGRQATVTWSMTAHTRCPAPKFRRCRPAAYRKLGMRNCTPSDGINVAPLNEVVLPSTSVKVP